MTLTGTEKVVISRSGNVHGNVNGLNTTEDSATLSFRQMIDCGNGDVEIEVLAINVAEGGAFNVTLPVGTYHLVASSRGESALINRLGFWRMRALNSFILRTVRSRLWFMLSM